MTVEFDPLADKLADDTCARSQEWGSYRVIPAKKYGLVQVSDMRSRQLTPRPIALPCSDGRADRMNPPGAAGFRATWTSGAMDMVGPALGQPRL